MRIQHNIMALNAYRQLGGNNSALAKNLEKLSSGYRINRAGDDAAGLAISEKMRAQIKGLEAAQKNANDGISLVQTAEGALTEVHSMLNRMVYLATQSANGTYDNEVDRANLDKEVQTLKEEIDRISKSTNFNGLKLLDGSMDANATQTTGGTTDVPILQDVATDPTTEVGTKTVLHKDNPEPGKTKITADLHNVAVTAKAQDGDSLRFTIGDTTVDIKIVAPDDPQANDATVLKASGKNSDGTEFTSQGYDSVAIANAIKAKFEEQGGLISGQKFNVNVETAADGSGRLVFEQAQEPNDPTEVVNANLDVKVDYISNPSGNPKDYTTIINKDALVKGSMINIGGDQYVIGEGKLAAATDLKTAFGAAANPNGFETEKGYKVKYDDATGTLTITDPKGALGVPAIKYDGYDGAVKLNTTEKKGTDEVKASATYAVAGRGNGDKITIGNEIYTTTDGITYTYDKTASQAADATAPDDASYTIKADDATSDLTIESTKEGAEAADGNGPITAGSIKYKFAEDDLTATDANVDATTPANSTPAKATVTLAAAPAKDDSIKFTLKDGTAVTLTFDGNNWAGNNDFDVAYDANTKGLTITAKYAGNVDTSLDIDNTKDMKYTYADRTNPNAVTLAGGTNEAGSSREVNFGSANLQDGDKIIFTGADGKSVQVIFDTDMETTLTNAGLYDATTGAAAGALKYNEAGDLAPKISFNADKMTVTFENPTPGEAGEIPNFKVETSRKNETKGEVKTAANAATITGTWNVQTTQNKQGAAANGGQLASTTFDLTADMVKDGNSLTIGKETYVFKIGKDSTTKAAPGQTVIDLSKYEADSADLIDAAGSALANETNNKAFTIGYADNGKISIHEKEGQTDYVDGELESVEEFDKLVYMKSPEVTTSTGKGLTFQVGDTADDFQKVALSIHDMSSKGLDIADVDIKTIDSAAAAIDKIKAAINTVSSQRGDLGAIQNRLEHTINNLGVQTENITAAESRIRDTDMAEEMMAYTKNNILVQAAQAMLAQANQVPQGVLQLLQ